MAAPGQNEPIIYNDGDGQADPRAAINTGAITQSTDKANEAHEEHVASKIKDGKIKGITSKMSMLPGYNIDPDRIEKAINPQYRKQNEEVENPNVKKDNLNTMDASGQVKSTTGNQSMIRSKDDDNDDRMRDSTLPSQEPNSQFRPSRNDGPESRQSTLGKNANIRAMNEDDDKYKNVLDNAVIGTSTEDDNKFKKVLDNATESCDTSLMATTNDIVTNIGNKLPTMTRHGKINEIDDGIYGEI
jgi:hypothetical protein